MTINGGLKLLTYPSFSPTRLLASALLLLASIAASTTLHAQAIAVRNDVPRVGQQEVLMLRHAFIERGQYQTWYQAD